ncbi:inner centromere protein-like [Paramacrobiotus metropolitanus]|uniref:inner centromere protein-like n=1 Tax=Paramacrobiotus metropolitanus TaxID=2943436 RepID=UPI0024465BF3|nr:inner centromere protein-like [Paramacrobiotus metropolitanus]
MADVNDNPQSRTKNRRNRFTAELDLLVAEESSAQNPYAARNPRECWEKIAENLTATKKFKIPLTDRACQVRVEKLIEAFVKQDLRNLVRTGTEEIYGRIEAALLSLSESKRDAHALNDQKKQQKAAEAQKRNAETALIQNAGESTFTKKKRVDDLADYRLPSSSASGATDGSDDDEWVDSAAEEEAAMQKPDYDPVAYEREKAARRLRQKRSRPAAVKSTKASAEMEAVKAIAEGDKMKCSIKEKELKQAREFEEKKIEQERQLREKQMEQEKELRSAEDERKYTVRMRELDLQEREIACREREIALKEKMSGN